MDTDREPGDVLRYTVLTETPDSLVEAARSTVDQLRAAGWKARFAMQSYTDGSRYKGLHVGFRNALGDQVEVQFHSAASMAVKEATTPHYRVERSASATDHQRAAARAACVELSNSLSIPNGISDLQTLGGVRVRVSNYSDSRSGIVSTTARIGHRATSRSPHEQVTRVDRNGGMIR